MSPCDPQIVGIPKAQLFLNFVYVSILFTPKIQVSPIASRSQSETLYSHQSTPSNNWWFCDLRHVPASSKMRKSAVIFDTSR